MELLLLFLLTSVQQGGDLNETLQKLLAFYRENRELILMLARGTPAAAPAETASASADDSAGTSANGSQKQDSSHEKKDRPPEDSPIVSILEEYLNRSAAH